jgi:predicted secreted protein
LQINLPSSLASPGNISGTFHLASFEQNGEHDGAVEFSATFQSSGTVTYTASSA